MGMDINTISSLGKNIDNEVVVSNGYMYFCHNINTVTETQKTAASAEGVVGG
jgi:hypothetical protein